MTDFEKSIIDRYNQEVKNAHIKNIMIGFETANQMILDNINNGASLDEIKKFIELNLSTQGKKAMKKAIDKQ